MEPSNMEGDIIEKDGKYYIDKREECGYVLEVKPVIFENKTYYTNTFLQIYLNDEGYEIGRFRSCCKLSENMYDKNPELRKYSSDCMLCKIRKENGESSHSLFRRFKGFIFGKDKFFNQI